MNHSTQRNIRNLSIAILVIGGLTLFLFSALFDVFIGNRPYSAMRG